MTVESKNSINSIFEEFLEISKSNKSNYNSIDNMNSLNNHFKFNLKNTKIIHIAGSKGKGSTATFIANIFKKHNLKVGLFTSPHIISYLERFVILNEKHDLNLIQNIAYDILNFNDNAKSFKPHFFELILCLAMIYFTEKNCDFIILETGIGGRLDATNYFSTILQIITSIELEHQKYLGDTIEKIAYEKAGIIKKNSKVFIGEMLSKPKKIIEKIAYEKNCQIISIKNIIKSIKYADNNLYNIIFQDNTSLQLHPKFIGKHQVQNSILALKTAEAILPNYNLNISKKAIENVTLKGRLELVNNAPMIFYDVAHTKNSIASTFDAYYACVSKIKPIVIFSCTTEKNHEILLKEIKNNCLLLIVTKISNFKKSNTEEIFKYSLFLNIPSKLFINNNEAFKQALYFSKNKIPIIILGSFYLISNFKIKNIL